MKASHLLKISGRQSIRFQRFSAKIFKAVIARRYIFPITGGILIIAFFWQSWNQISDILTLPLAPLPEKLLLYQLLLILILLVIFFFAAALFIKNRPYKNFYFIEEAGLKWKVSKHSGTAKREPFCSKHQIELMEHKKLTVGFKEGLVSYYCPICKKYIVKDLPESEIRYILEIVKRKAEAIDSKHNIAF